RSGAPSSGRGRHHGRASRCYVSKTALDALTRTLAVELRPAGILVHAICPGWAATDTGGRGDRPVAEGAASVVWEGHAAGRRSYRRILPRRPAAALVAGYG